MHILYAQKNATVRVSICPFKKLNNMFSKIPENVSILIKWKLRNSYSVCLINITINKSNTNCKYMLIMAVSINNINNNIDRISLDLLIIDQSHKIFCYIYAYNVIIKYGKKAFSFVRKHFSSPSLKQVFSP